MLDQNGADTFPDALSDTLILRESGISDIDELIRIRMDFLRVDFIMTEEEEQTILRELQTYIPLNIGKELLAFCAFDRDIMVSSVFLVISKRPPNPFMPNGMCGYVSNVYTDPAYRGRGIATGLLNLAEAKAREICLSSLDLIATDKGRPLYEKMGFIKNERYMRLLLK